MPVELIGVAQLRQGRVVTGASRVSIPRRAAMALPVVVARDAEGASAIPKPIAVGRLPAWRRARRAVAARSVETLARAPVASPSK